MGNFFSAKGQTLIEVLVALSISVILLFGITTAVIYSLNNIQASKNQNLANHYAEQGIEMVRKIWNSDLTAFNQLTKNYYCLDKDAVTLTDVNEKDGTIAGCSYINKVPPSGNNVDSFAREVDIFKNSLDCASSSPVPTPSPAPGETSTKVVVKVSWSDSKCTSKLSIYCHSVELTSCLSKNYTIQP